MAGERTIEAGTPESRQMAEGVLRAVRCTERLNAIPYDDRERIAAAWSELTGQPVDPTLHLIPPVYSDCGLNLRLGRNVFVNQGCRLDDIGGIELGDDVMLGPGVRIISSGHPLHPARVDAGSPPRRSSSDATSGSAPVPPSSRASRSATTPWWPPARWSPTTSHPRSSSPASRRGE